MAMACTGGRGSTSDERRGARALRLLAASALLAGLVATGAPGCKTSTGTDVGNGVVISLNMTGYEGPPPSGAQALQLSTGVMIDGLWVVTGKFRYRQGTNCSGDDAAVDQVGPFVADLAGKGFLDGPLDISRQAGAYCRLRFELGALVGPSPAGAPAELTGASVLMHGHRADGTAFTVRSTSDFELRLDAKSTSFSLSEGQSALVLAFDLRKLSDALALDSLSGSPIVIDDSNNQDALKRFEGALRTGCELYRDGNDDGALEPGERASGKAIAQGGP
jgi:hypothetical protein